MKTARALAKSAVTDKLAACVNLIPGIESHYRWNEKVESSKEVQLVFKTTTAKVRALEKFILAKHPYSTPEFLVLKPVVGSAKYLAWLAASCA
jgi:periplasmic divalent cation tolerance protein